MLHYLNILNREDQNLSVNQFYKIGLRVVKMARNEHETALKSRIRKVCLGSQSLTSKPKSALFFSLAKRIDRFLNNAIYAGH